MQLAFTPRHVELMRPVIQAALDELLAAVRPAGRMELIADVADPLPSMSIAAMLGLPPQDRPRFKGWTDDIYGFLGLSAVPLAERTRQATASAGQLRAYLADLFAARRRQPRDDLLARCWPPRSRAIDSPRPSCSATWSAWSTPATRPRPT